MKLQKLIVPVVVLLLICFWQACKKDNEQPKDNFDRSALLNSIADNVLLPAHQRMVTSTADLTAATEAFVSQPNANTLETMQDAWLVTKLDNKHIAPFNFGPATDQLVHNRIDKWPTNTAFIENFIATEDTITSAFINTIGSTSVGLPAMEYLIFSHSGNNAIIDSFTTSARADVRKQYLLALAQSLQQAADVLINIWANSGDDYVTEFVSNTGNGLDGSVNIMVNQLIANTEKLLRQNIANALEANDPEQVEAPYAHHSLDLIHQTVLSLSNTYTSRGISNVGFDDYLNELNAKYKGGSLDDTIKGQIATVLTKINEVPRPLSNAVVNSPAQVQELYDALRELLILIKVDMASSLSVTVTFSDNDGD